MRLAVSCQGERLTDPVDPRFGRARHFVVFDTETEELSVIDNAEQVEAVQGAGVQAAHRLVAEGVEAVLTRRCGPKALEVLESAGVGVYTAPDTSAYDAIRGWSRHERERITEPDPAGHPRG